MGISVALQWWEEWQLRILVLGSLSVQFFLFFAVWVRRVPSLGRLKVLVWLAYIGGDALAIYALATLFNRHSKRTSSMADAGQSSSALALEVIWAPVLLIHLGGHLTMSAYSLEDNELWTRHAITLVSQVTVALYVFCKSWSGEELLPAAVMLFVFGIVKFSIKPMALRRASFNHMLASTEMSPPRENACYVPWWTCCTSDNRLKKRRSDRAAEGTISLDEYVQQAKACVAEARRPIQEAIGQEVELAISYTDYFVDLSAPYSGRLSDLRSFLQPPNGKKAYDILQKCFEDTYDLLYTRVGFTPIENLMVYLLPFLALAAVVLFATSNKHDYDKKDVKVTYILFCCTTAIEFFLPVCSLAPCLPCLDFLLKPLSGWHDKVSQYNLLSFYVRKKEPTILMKLAYFNCFREYVSRNLYVSQKSAASEITELVQQHIEDGWKLFICDAATYRRFNDLRGQLTLTRQHQLGELGEILNLSFGKSVLLWHIATDLCIHHPSGSSIKGSALKRSREISNYMIYLLYVRPDILSRGTRLGLFAFAIYDLELIMKNCTTPLHNEETIAREIIDHPLMMSPSEGALIHESRKLAESLMKLDEVKRWQVIQGVWVEMLCYSASRCRGYVHAKSLGEGGECLSYVWLLWSYMGMETLPDKIHKPQTSGEKEHAVDGEPSHDSYGGAVVHQIAGYP